MRFPLRIKHPDHGFMHVYNAHELAEHQKRGWEPEDQPEITVTEVKPVRRGRRGNSADNL